MHIRLITVIAVRDFFDGRLAKWSIVLLLLSKTVLRELNRTEEFDPCCMRTGTPRNCEIQSFTAEKQQPPSVRNLCLSDPANEVPFKRQGSGAPGVRALVDGELSPRRLRDLCRLILGSGFVACEIVGVCPLSKVLRKML